jgi:hypothetical protein
MDAQVTFRARVVAMYQKYCPEKALSHVEFLLTKYRGYEDELIEVLVEKYGPEPLSSAQQQYEQELASYVGPTHSAASVSKALDGFKGMEELLLFATKEHSRLPQSSLTAEERTISDGAREEQSMLLRESDADRGVVFQERQEQFRRDMSALSKVRQNQTAQALQDVMRSAHDTVQSQERDIRMLRSDLQAIKRRHEEHAMSLQEEMRSAACELTKHRLELLRLEGLAVPGEVPFAALAEVEAETSLVTKQTLQALRSLYVLERVARTHLALYPVTPFRTKLRTIDSVLSARLDVL